MASKQGIIMATPPTAYGHDLLLDELINFLTTDVSLVAAGQNWTLLNDNHAAISADRFVYLRGPGLAGADQVFVQIRRFTITGVAQPVCNWEIRGAQGYDSALSFNNQPGVSPKTELVLYDEDIPYWFFANGRRFVVNARILTIHTNCYCGLYLPYATSAELRYPLVILATTEATNLSYLSDLGNNFNGFFYPKSVYTSPQSTAPGHILKRDGVWVGVVNRTGIQTNDTYRLGITAPYFQDGVAVRPSEEGIISTFPIILIVYDFPSRGDGSMYGELDGVKWVTGGPYTEQEDVIQISSGINYRTISDSGRIALNNMAAVLED